MEDYEEFLKGVKEDFYKSMEMAADPNLMAAFKDLAYISLCGIGNFMEENGIDLENPTTLNDSKKKALEELIPEIKEMKSLLEEALSPIGIPISSIEN
ncbi:MAG: hypothetical protein AABX93_01920 [Nanoarchaeota archaeon]